MGDGSGDLSRGPDMIDEVVPGGRDPPPVAGQGSVRAARVGRSGRERERRPSVEPCRDYC
ncbi:hypothetical protein [Streptosporangium sp. V21-05]|uniref:hypothetical protein n=1 Tax=Streptosporangium sp. V21-05 TaxID=3446115 RepID=UPI003F532CAB